jgi:hypothetical protein
MTHGRLLLLRAVETQSDVSSLLRILLLLGHRRETGWRGRFSLDLPAYGDGPDGLGDRILVAIAPHDEPEMREVLSAVAGRFQIRAVDAAETDGWSRLVRARPLQPDAALVRRLARRAIRRGDPVPEIKRTIERRGPTFPCIMLPSRSQSGRMYPFLIGRQTSPAPVSATIHDGWPIGTWMPRLDPTRKQATN